LAALDVAAELPPCPAVSAPGLAVGDPPQAASTIDEATMTTAREATR